MGFTILILANIILSAVLYLLEKNTKFSKINKIKKQIIIGVLFGLLSIAATEFGVEYAGAIINVRDAAPLCAGLIFGGPAGIISGIMGAAYRWFCVYWGGGLYSRVACTISTFIIGVIGAILRKYMFDNKKPTWGYGVGIAVVCEVMHMLILFLTRISDTVTAFELVSAATFPMVLSNAVAVGGSIIIVALLSKERKNNKPKQKPITTTFQRWLLICIVIALIATSSFTYIFQSNTTISETESMINLTLDDIQQDIIDTADSSLLDVTYEILEVYQNSQNLSSEDLLAIADEYDVAGINIIDEDNIVVNSSTKTFIGFDMLSGEQSSEFVTELETQDSFVQNYLALSIDYDISSKYARINLDDGGFIQVGYDAKQLQSSIDEIVIGIAQNRHIGTTGFVVICDEEFNIVNNNSDYLDEDIEAVGLNLDSEDIVSGEVYEVTIDDTQYFCSYTFAEGYYIIGLYGQSEAMLTRNVSIYLYMFMNTVIFATLFALIYFLIKFVIIDNLVKINSSLAKITEGDLEVVVDVRDSEEFSSLSDDINSTVDTLKRHIEEASSRIDKELAFAKSIQLSALPNVFPTNPEKEGFDVYAQMYAAKEVGGDFYDFYKLGKDKLVFLVADVSGKGIPAAMFMMKAKTIIKDLSETDISIEEVITIANQKLCENNESGMFVTAWLGMLDLKTGKVSYVNAGHNPPVIKKANGEVMYLKSKASFVLGGFETIKYKANEVQLDEGDKILLYTDGVTEATNCHDELYGEERLLKFVEKDNITSLKDFLFKLKEDIDLFVGTAEQFDDITTLVLSLGTIKGEPLMKEKTFDAQVSELDNLVEFLETELDTFGCDFKTKMQLNIAIEEVFVNIARYAYPESAGTVSFSIGLNKENNSIKMILSDSGIKFNPLEKEEPDIGLSAQEREIGGLGIFISKKTMDSLKYEYKNGKNILYMKKTINIKEI